MMRNGNSSVPKVAILTGGFDRPYAYGLSMALGARGVRLEVVGSDEVDSPEMHTTPGLTFLNFQRGWQPTTNLAVRVTRLAGLYLRLVRHALTSRARVFHILWNTKVPVIDRLLLMCLYKASGKRVVLTAHNVNTAKRDGNDTWLNRLTLGVQYRLTDHIFVHTAGMREELAREFKTALDKVTVIPFGINNAVANTDLTPEQARRTLGIGANERILLFFGRIQPYKGLEYLVQAVEKLSSDGLSQYRLIIAGEPKKESRGYWERIQAQIKEGPIQDRVLKKLQYIADDEAELYFKAADAAVLPYCDIYQSGVMFLSYSFGLPVIASDVGAFREEIMEGQTGFLCEPRNAVSLAHAIGEYFASDLYKNLDTARGFIREYAGRRYSWASVAEATTGVYARVEEG
ncbi:MAG: glycosyltransferase family 4 protein [Bryobacterales bacterium]|nr:glycosyltransferase family 4 protein [Bryobacterales bacterium]